MSTNKLSPSSSSLRQASDQIDVERTIARLQNEMSDIGLRKLETQNELSTLNSKFKGGAWLDTEDYARTVKRQVQLKSDLYEYERQIIERKQRVRLLSVEKDQLKNRARPESDLDGDSKIVASLRWLRNKYAAMASDHTRLGPVRTVAEEISDELSQVILKHVRKDVSRDE